VAHLSPFVLKFSHAAGTTVSSVIVGIAIIVLGAYWACRALAAAPASKTAAARWCKGGLEHAQAIA